MRKLSQVKIFEWSSIEPINHSILKKITKINKNPSFLNIKIIFFIFVMSSSSSSDSSEAKANRRIYVTGYSHKEDQHDMKKMFKKYGKIDEFSWKGKYFFVVN